VSIVRIGIFLVIGLSVVSLAARAQGDAARGKVVFMQCMACHSLKAGENRIGPSLHGLFGRKAGTVSDFPYSPSMQRSGITWNEQALKSYLPDPQARVPGTKMIFVGISDPKKVDDVTAYLKEATK
jgi:cytochrome c